MIIILANEFEEKVPGLDSVALGSAFVPFLALAGLALPGPVLPPRLAGAGVFDLADLLDGLA